MDHPDELLNFFKALADKKRLQLPGLLGEQQLPIEEIAERLNVKPSEATRHVERLMEIGLIKFTNRHGVAVYYLDTANLEQTAKRLLAQPKQLAPAAQTAPTEFARKVLGEFLNADGTIKEFPAQPKKFGVVVDYVLSLFEIGKRYPEKEVNAIIKQVHPDSARLRRTMIDHKLMARAHGVYWRL